MFSLAYFVVDLFLLLKVFKRNTKLGKQSLVHHYLCIFVYILCLLGGIHLPAISQSVMLCEVSNIFLCIRDFLGKKASGLASELNIAAFFLSFTLFRMIFFPAVLYAHFTTISILADSGFMTIFAWVFSAIIFFLVFLLNSYWYYFMVKRVQKMLAPSRTKNIGDIDYDDGFDEMAEENANINE